MTFLLCQVAARTLAADTLLLASGGCVADLLDPGSDTIPATVRFVAVEGGCRVLDGETRSFASLRMTGGLTNRPTETGRGVILSEREGSHPERMAEVVAIQDR